MILLQILIWSLAPASAREIVKSGPEQVPMLELFSSESCPSCPPAEKWIGKLEKNAKLWVSFVPMVFLVDYGNTQDARMERHKAHARTWAQNNLYTPAFVLNGEEWDGWTGSSAPPPRPGDKPGVLAIEASPGGYTVIFTPEDKKAEDLSLHLALLGMDVKGSRLTHNFLVLDWRQKFVMKARQGKFTAEFTGLSPKMNPSRQALVAWVQAGSAPKPLQATGAFKN